MDENIETSDKKQVLTIDPSVIRAIKISIALIAVVLCVMMVATPLINAYNLLVDSDLQVQRAAANVKTDLERRADLIPNLVETVKGSAQYEYKVQHDTYVEVAQARALADASHIKNTFQQASSTDLASTGAPEEQQLTQILGNFVKLQEQYPDLKLNTVTQFRELGAQITATENQILVDRQTYNAAVTQYQRICRGFPTVLVANYYGFNPDKYHMYIPANQTRAEEVSAVTFDFSTL